MKLLEKGDKMKNKRQQEPKVFGMYSVRVMTFKEEIKYVLANSPKDAKKQIYNDLYEEHLTQTIDFSKMSKAEIKNRNIHSYSSDRAESLVSEPELVKNSNEEKDEHEGKMEAEYINSL